jgi:hypothetical protein
VRRFRAKQPWKNFLELAMHMIDNALSVFSNLTMEHINALIAMLALGVAGLAVYLALHTVKGRKG